MAQQEEKATPPVRNYLAEDGSEREGEREVARCSTKKRDDNDNEEEASKAEE